MVQSERQTTQEAFKIVQTKYNKGSNQGKGKEYKEKGSIKRGRACRVDERGEKGRKIQADGTSIEVDTIGNK